jgi:hypothetical protein
MKEQTNPFMDTHGRIMPYYFKRLDNGKIRIAMLRGPILVVSLEEAKNVLSHEDLSTQKKKMYQAVLAWNDKDVQQ